MLAVVCLLILTIAMLALPVALKRMWHDERVGRSVPYWWAYGEVAWRGYIRAMPSIAAVGGPGLVVAAWCFVLGTSLDGHNIVENSAVREWLHIGAVAGAACAIVGVVIGAIVFLFNKPRSVVAPYLRKDPGAIDAWHAGSLEGR